ncbi:MFS transporter [Patulibacter defluvii]|uniref:MFS transporter n=1 Tax=Patulibacter defluvii TaxID=3095358 RepID=UPI002A753362|nr:MFS transporter [Patulibacter sp. DM4]
MSPAHPRRWAALAVIALAQFIVIMDTSIIGVALPEIQADLGFSPDALSWVFNAYVIAFGGLLLLGGRLSDLLGPQRVFSAGWAILAVGSLAAGLAGSVGVEVAARALQGVGAALIAPSALALIIALFGAEPKELMKAFAVYGAASPAGGTAGVFLGGVITEWISWPWVFYINIPIAIAVLVAAPRVMPRLERRSGAIDWWGAITATAGLALVVFGVVRAPEEGWGSAATLLSLAAGAVLLGAFLVLQANRRVPLVRLAIFRAPNLAAANGVMLLLGAAWIPTWFFLNLYLQQVLGLGAFAGGAALLPMTLTVMVLILAVTPRVIGWIGPKATIVGGLFVLGLGMVLLSLIRADGSFAADVLPGSVIAAAGMALPFIPALNTAISAAPPEEGGLASGIVNTSYQVGSAIGLAVMTVIANGQGATDLGNPAALTDGYSAVFVGAAAIAVAGALLGLVALRGSAAAGSDAEAGTPAGDAA